ncbi:glycosyltransferase [Candidatus Enterococcus ikei]|uniref:Glycosyltransferase n=1 Tax=Candidatus Enterococcus ikei TaxID=2815326 RepID=A0ABS3GWK4_9ENTE|nr:glycosyltransferase [Enterococcus sp. DIV0869a]
MIPVFNTELRIEKCLKSIQNQTYTSYEAIIVDEGFEDNSIFICEQYQKRYK